MAEPAYLLDTHALLWYAQAPQLLPEEVIQLIRQPAAVIYLSRVSLLEIAIRLVPKLKDLQTSVMLNAVKHLYRNVERCG